jgi:hypothetical protein
MKTVLKWTYFTKLVRQVNLLRTGLRLRRRCASAYEHVGYEQVKQKTMSCYLAMRCFVSFSSSSIIMVVLSRHHMMSPWSNLAYHVPHYSLFSRMVVQLESGHCVIHVKSRTSLAIFCLWLSLNPLWQFAPLFTSTTILFRSYPNHWRIANIHS